MFTQGDLKDYILYVVRESECLSHKPSIDEVVRSATALLIAHETIKAHREGLADLSQATQFIGLSIPS